MKTAVYVYLITYEFDKTMKRNQRIVTEWIKELSRKKIIQMGRVLRFGVGTIKILQKLILFAYSVDHSQETNGI